VGTGLCAGPWWCASATALLVGTGRCAGPWWCASATALLVGTGLCAGPWWCADLLAVIHQAVPPCGSATWSVALGRAGGAQRHPRA